MRLRRTLYLSRLRIGGHRVEHGAGTLVDVRTQHKREQLFARARSDALEIQAVVVVVQIELRTGDDFGTGLGFNTHDDGLTVIHAVQITRIVAKAHAIARAIRVSQATRAVHAAHLRCRPHAQRRLVDAVTLSGLQVAGVVRTIGILFTTYVSNAGPHTRSRNALIVDRATQRVIAQRTGNRIMGHDSRGRIARIHRAHIRIGNRCNVAADRVAA